MTIFMSITNYYSFKMTIKMTKLASGDIKAFFTELFSISL